MPRSLPDFAYVSSILHYDLNTGVLTWKRRPREHFANARAWSWWNTQYAGMEAGCVRRNGQTFYRGVSIDGHQYLAHRVAYLLHHGVWPEAQIDHIDGNGLNNRATNLRGVDNQENSRNSRMRLDNTSGVNGVSRCKLRNKWRATVKINGRLRHIGYFDTLEEAAAARLAANEQHDFTKRHGAPQTPDDALTPLFG